MSENYSTSALSWRRLYLSRAKLKAVSQTSALLSGFAMVAMVEMSIEGDASSDRRVPESLLIVFVSCTALLVSIHLMALMISTCILPNIDVVSSLGNEQAAHESPHDELKVCVEMAWVCSTGLGILLFLAEVAILSWVKFYWISQHAAMASTAIVIPAGILFLVFSCVFYRKLMAHKYQRHFQDLRELDALVRGLHTTDEHIRVV